MIPDWRSGLGNFILNSWAHPTTDDDMRRTLFNFPRRTQAASREYQETRRAQHEGGGAARVCEAPLPSQPIPDHASRQDP